MNWTKCVGVLVDVILFCYHGEVVWIQVWRIVLERNAISTYCKALYLDNVELNDVGGL